MKIFALIGIMSSVVIVTISAINENWAAVAGWTLVAAYQSFFLLKSDEE